MCSKTDVFAVAFDVQRQEVGRVDSFGGEVVKGANQCFAFSLFAPGWIAVLPVDQMSRIGMDLVVGTGFAIFVAGFDSVRAIEICERQQILWAVGASFEPILTSVPESKIPFGIGDDSPSVSQVDFVALIDADSETSVCVFNFDLCGRIFAGIDCDVLALMHGCRVIPLPCSLRPEPCLPHVA